MGSAREEHTKALVGWMDIDADLSDQRTVKWLQGRIPENALIISSDLKGLREINFGLWEAKQPMRSRSLIPKNRVSFGRSP